MPWPLTPPNLKTGAKMARPSDYDPAYCEQLIERSGEGLSLTAFASEIGVARSTINEWMRVHPEFSEAVNQAKAKALAWWEQQGRKIVKDGGSSAQATLAIFGMKNMGGEDWRDVKSTELTGRDGGPIEHKALDPAKLSDETLREIAAASHDG